MTMRRSLILGAVGGLVIAAAVTVWMIAVDDLSTEVWNDWDYDDS